MCFKSLSELYTLPKKQRWGSRKTVVKKMLVYYRVTGDDEECCQIVAWAIARVCKRKTKRKVLELLCTFLQTHIEHLSDKECAMLQQALRSRNRNT